MDWATETSKDKRQWNSSVGTRKKWFQEQAGRVVVEMKVLSPVPVKYLQMQHCEKQNLP